MNFPTTNVDSTSATQVVTVTDAGNQALLVSNLVISANFASEPSGGTDCTSSTDIECKRAMRNRSSVCADDEWDADGNGGACPTMR